MKIGIIYFNMALGKTVGSAVYTRHLVEELAKLKNEVTIICNKGENPQIPGVRIIALNTPPYGSWSNCIADPISFERTIHTYTHALLKIVMKKEIEIVHAQHCLFSTIPALASRILFKTPFVTTCHGTEIYEAKSDVRMLKMLSVTKFASKIIAVSNPLEKELHKIYRNTPIITITPGIDTNIFRPRDSKEVINKRLNIPKDAVVLLYVGRLVPEKGVRCLPTVLEKIKKKLTNVVLVVVGKGPLYDELVIDAKQKGLMTNVRFLNSVPEAQLAQLYAAADVVVVPSLWSEPFGLVPLEAAASGTPVVATSVGGMREALSQIDSNALVPPNDLNALTNRIVERASNPLTSNKKAQLHAKVETNYSWKNIAKKIVKVYRNSLANNNE